MEDVLHHGADLVRAKAICVFVHGRGQTPEDMVDQVIRHLPQDVAYLLPRAANGLWYTARAIDPLTDATRAELASSIAQVRRVIGMAQAASSAPVALAGFSRGACVSLELAFAGVASLAALVAFTGCRVGDAEDIRPLALPRGMPVYLTGGDDDPWIPVSAFAQAAMDLARNGAALRADIFPEREHEVSPPERAMLASILDDLARGRVPAMAVPR